MGLKRWNRAWRFLIAIGIAGAFLPACASAPKPIIPAPQMVGTHHATRAQLEATADSLRSIIAASGVSDTVASAAASLVKLEERLEVGDFRRGDVIFLTVPEDNRWTDTFTVKPNQTIELQDIPAISLYGALYSEGPDRVLLALSEYLRDPEITMESTKRVAILGDVREPGFYNISGPELISEAIMLAGGPGKNARMDKVELKRGETALARLPSDIVQSMTLDELGVQSGDEIFVPSLEQANLLLRNIGLVIGLTVSTIGLIALVF